MIIRALLLVMVSTVLCAGNEEELFLRGNKYYQQHDYDNALISYELLQAKGRAVLYNMGNCYYHKNDYPQALAYWTRAQSGATNQELLTIERNKQHILKKLGKSVTKTFMQKVIELLQSTTFYISLFCLQILFLLCWYFILFLACRRSRVKKRVVGLLCIIILLVGATLRVEYNKQNTSSAIVTSQQAFVFAGPDKGFHSLCPLAYADTVVIKEKREGWYKIGYTGIIGWVEAGVIQIV